MEGKIRRAQLFVAAIAFASGCIQICTRTGTDPCIVNRIALPIVWSSGQLK